MRPTITKTGLFRFLDGFDRWRRYFIDDAMTARREYAATEGFPVSCGKGCSACCNLFVSINAADAFLIAQHLKDKGLDTDEFKQRLWDAGEAMNKYEQDPSGYFRLQKPCVFIKDRECSIYSVRPAICRLCTSCLPASECEKLGDEDHKGKAVNVDDIKAKLSAKSTQFGALFWVAADGCLPEMVLWALEELARLDVLYPEEKANV